MGKNKKDKMGLHPADQHRKDEKKKLLTKLKKERVAKKEAKFEADPAAIAAELTRMRNHARGRIPHAPMRARAHAPNPPPSHASTHARTHALRPTNTPSHAFRRTTKSRAVRPRACAPRSRTWRPCSKRPSAAAPRRRPSNARNANWAPNAVARPTARGPNAEAQP